MTPPASRAAGRRGIQLPSAAAVRVGPMLHQKKKKKIRAVRRSSGTEMARRGAGRGSGDKLTSRVSEFGGVKRGNVSGLLREPRSGFVRQRVSAEIGSGRIELDIEGVDANVQERWYRGDTCMTRSMLFSRFLF